MMDPQGGHFQEALESYQESQRLYEDLLQYPERLHQPEILETRYAETCTKVGITLVQVMDPMEHQPEWAQTIMMMSGRGNTNEEGGGEQTKTTTRTVTPDDENNKKKNPLQEAQSMFETAIHIYQKYTHPDFVKGSRYMDEMQVLDLKFGLSLALQHAASTATLAGQLANGIDYFQQAISLQVDTLLPRWQRHSQEEFDSQVAVADLYMCLADAAVQAGDYKLAKDTYAKAMQWHTQHNIEVAPIYPIMEDQDDGALQEYVHALKEYREMLQSPNGQPKQKKSSIYYPKGNHEDEEYYADADDGYEGDLHASIGGLYLERGEAEHGMGHLEQAVRLYQTKGEGTERPTADVKLNLAMAYYRVRRFADSQRVQFEALDIYRELYKDGVNPFTQDWDEAAQAGGARPTQKKEENTQNAAAHMVDVEQFKQSIKNATEAGASKDVKEEL
jgi:tetratricopeptide (TPR) repeat protein